MTWIGALIAFTAAVATAVALVLQALEARSSPPSEGASVRLLLDLARRPRWLFGTSLVIIAWSLQIVALGFAPITLVQPILASFQLVLLVLARVWLKERINLCEYGGVAAIIVGILLLIMAAPQRSVLHPSASRLAPPLVLLAGAILFALVLARRRQRSGRSSGLQVTIGAGVGYAWADLVDKLVSNNATSHHFVIAALWLLTVMIMGGIAFTLEQTALQRRPASAVGPLIAALQMPLPVLLALWCGLEAWQGGVLRALGLVAGLILVGCGATVIARSPAVTSVAADAATA